MTVAFVVGDGSYHSQCYWYASSAPERNGSHYGSAIVSLMCMSHKTNIYNVLQMLTQEILACRLPFS
jgi:hypothetical protein